MSKEEVTNYIHENRIICPNPIQWQLFYKMIVRRLHPKEYVGMNAENMFKKHGIPYPLVLGGWQRSSEDKKQVFIEQIEIGFDNGLGENVKKYIYSLKKEQLFYFD
tara:strand:+ start:461 stop:778 length:318 start_codon:yes stop_codon:yes gene_type:complete